MQRALSPADVIEQRAARLQCEQPGFVVAAEVVERLAQPFEQLRDASDRLRERTGARPKIFLACLGKPADFNARATFAVVLGCRH